MKRELGFTVVELLIIVALLGIIVVIAAQIGPSVTAQARFTGAVNNFLADFSAVKQLAATENRYVAIIFSADDHSYTIQKQTDITNYTNWTLVKKVTPFSDLSFFDTGDVQDFVVNSIGEVRPYPVPMPISVPTGVELKFNIKFKGKNAYQSKMRIFPYGGLKVEK